MGSAADAKQYPPRPVTSTGRCVIRRAGDCAPVLRSDSPVGSARDSQSYLAHSEAEAGQSSRPLQGPLSISLPEPVLQGTGPGEPLGH